jgi:hypothetical protein
MGSLQADNWKNLNSGKKTSSPALLRAAKDLGTLLRENQFPWQVERVARSLYNTDICPQ